MSSSKWRAIQHRHRYTYSAVVFPASYIDSLKRIHSPNPLVSNFITHLLHLSSLNSTYAQISHSNHLSSLFITLLLSPHTHPDLLLQASTLYLHLLFLDNSLPLHRTLLSPLPRLHSPHHPLIIKSFHSLLLLLHPSIHENPFSLSRVAFSILTLPKQCCLLDVVGELSHLVASDIVFGLNSLLSHSSHWPRPSPLAMEHCQGALSCLHYLLQRFPSTLVKNSEVSAVVVTVILGVLKKSDTFSRDCLVTAGVGFWSAVQTFISPQELSVFIMAGMFGMPFFNPLLSDALGKIPYKGDLVQELQGLCFLSRIFLIRGLLTSVPRTVLNDKLPVFYQNGCECGGSGSGSNLVTVLFNGILPQICDICDNPVDSHFNFHALTVLQICMQQIKTSLLSKLVNFVEEYDPIPEEMRIRIMKTVWSNLDDPLNQSVRQVHMIFDLFLDVNSVLHQGDDGGNVESFMWDLARDLISLGPCCKGRYVPLASLTKRLGAKFIMENMCPNLLSETITAYNDDDVCCAATSFLKCFLECLRDECWASDGIDGGYAVYRGICLPPFLTGLASGVSKLRSNLNTYALPVLLEKDEDGVVHLFDFVLDGENGGEGSPRYYDFPHTAISFGLDQRVAVLIALLKVARSLALIEGDIDYYVTAAGSEFHPEISCGRTRDCYAHVCIRGRNVKIPVEWLLLGLTHADNSLRIDAAESIFLNPKTSTLPSHLELDLIKECIPLNMRCCSTAFQMKFVSLFRKFFSRVRTALERQVKQGIWRPLFSHKYIEFGNCDSNENESLVNKAEDLFNFMRWLSSFLFFSCYPSSPYERKIIAMELILTMIDTWPLINNEDKKSYFVSPNTCYFPFGEGFISPESTLLLVGSIVDSWDRLRETSFHILVNFPTPLPGITDMDKVSEVVTWARKIVCSPRVRESDAGALTLKLIFKKYILELGWLVKPFACQVLSSSESGIHSNGHEIAMGDPIPVLEYIKSLLYWLKAAVEEGEEDLTEACRSSFVHGILLTLRYTFEELDLNSDVIMSNTNEMRCLMKFLLELVTRITSLALWVVSSDAWYLAGDMCDIVEDDIYSSEVRYSDQVQESSTPHDSSSSPPEQIVLVGCWLAIKEVSLLLGTVIRKIPLPSDSLDLSGMIKDDSISSARVEYDLMFDMKQLEEIGGNFLEVLLKMKHNGAIDKTRVGFTALCNRLLCSNVPSLCRLTESWMDRVMERTVCERQTVDDLLRRSAGLPAAYMALFLSEPEGVPKRLLPRALRRLIDLITDSSQGPSSAHVGSDEPALSEPGLSARPMDEGVIPTVHSFNILRAAFNDTHLAADTSGFAAEALVVTIRSFCSPHWHVRNSASLAFSALLRRMLGFLNPQSRDSTTRVLTGVEFFHRYPLLHPFLLEEMKIGSKCFKKNKVHPTLCPVLILLSRFKPSPITSIGGGGFDPFDFVPFVRSCSIQRDMRVRVLSSGALAGLISSGKLEGILLLLASELPETATRSRVSSNYVHGTLLQLRSLLETNLRRLPEPSRRSHIVSLILPLLRERSWVGRPSSCPCPPLNSAFLSVLDSLLRVCPNREDADAVSHLLLELSSHCFDITAGRITRHDPLASELREVAAGAFSACVFRERSPLLIPELSRRLLSLCVEDPSDQVRLMALKRIFRFGDSEDYWDGPEVEERLVERLEVERDPKCVLYILRILFSKNSSRFENPGKSLSGFWRRLVSLYGQMRQAKTRDSVLRCMGACVRRLRGIPGPAEEHFVSILRRCCGPSEPVTTRRAAADSIRACGILDEAKTVISTGGSQEVARVVDVWLLCVRLMEDEDVITRETASGAAHKCYGGEAVPSQVDQVMVRSFGFLTSIFGNTVEYFERVAGWVLEVVGGSGEGGGDPVRRVFEKEVDNHHEEKMFVVQICCRELEGMIPWAGERAGDEYLGGWRDRFYGEIVGRESMGGEWIGGAGNHKDVFLAVYTGLLGLYVFSKGGGMQIYDGLGELLRPFLGNPLVYNLYLSVSGVGETEFNPYFLIK